MTKWIPTLEESARPKFKRLADAIERDVYSGKLSPGDKLPTHRDLADDLKMNVSTVTRGYAEAEKGASSAVLWGGELSLPPMRSRHHQW